MLKLLKKNNLIFLILSVFFVIPSVVAFLGNGFPQTDDGNWMIIRFSAFYEALRVGQFPVRFLLRLNNDFGYPVSDFLYPLFMYVGVPIHLLGISFTQTIKVLFVSSILFSSFFTFLWLRKIFDNVSSLAGAIFYTLFPYHLFDIYKRGSLGEAISFPILSFTLWQVERSSLVFSSIGISLLILSHNTLALFFLSIIVGYGFYRKKIKQVITSIIFGFGISSFFWIPALYDLQYTVFSNTKISDFNSYFSDSLTLSLLGLGFLFLVLELLFKLFKTRNLKTLYMFLFLIFSSFLLLSFSKPVWAIFPLTNIIQFPFRLISIIIPIATFLLAFLLNSEKLQKKYMLFVIYIILIFISAIPFIKSTNTQIFPDSYYSTNLDTTTVKDEYMPKWVSKKPDFTTSKIEIINGSEKINLNTFNAKKISFNAFLTTKREIKVNVIYFPGWVVFVNGVRRSINYQENGIIMLNLDKGQNNVILEFREEGIRLAADILSMISLLAVLFVVVKRRK